MTDDVKVLMDEAVELMHQSTGVPPDRIYDSVLKILALVEVRRVADALSLIAERLEGRGQ